MLIAALIVVFAVVADQVTKALVVSHMALHEEARLLPGLIRLYHTRNTGAAFSMLSDHPWVFLLFSAVAMIALAVLLYKLRGRHWLLNVSMAMILGGGIGNMIDRVAVGYVVDFLDFQFMKFAVFNVADIFVTCGTAALAVYLLVFEPKVEKRLQEEQKQGEADDGDGSDRPEA